MGGWEEYFTVSEVMTQGQLGLFPPHHASPHLHPPTPLPSLLCSWPRLSLEGLPPLGPLCGRASGDWDPSGRLSLKALPRHGSL